MNLLRIPSMVAVTFLFGFSTTAVAQQTVFLDFDTGTAGSISYTTGMRDDIESLMDGHYADFDFTFTQITPGFGSFSTIFFNSGGPGGLAEHIDFRNVDKSDTAVVNIDGLGFSTTADLVSASAFVGSHELGHLQGLRHGDSMGPIGSGISSTLGPNPFHPDYPGPVSAHVDDHIMSSPASVGSSLSDLTTASFFSDRSYVKLEFNESGTAVAEAAGSKDTIGTAQAVTFDPLAALGSTKIPHDGPTWEYSAFVVADAEISSNNQSDLFKFEITAEDVASGAILNFEVISNIISDRLSADIDPTIAILDGAGSLGGFYYGTSAFNDDEFEGSRDSIIIDLLASEMGVGTFYVEVTPFKNNDKGFYDLFGYKVTNVPEPTSCAMFGIAMLGMARRRRSSL